MIRTAVVVCAVVGLLLAFGVLRTQPILEAAPLPAKPVVVAAEPRALPASPARPLSGEKPRASAPIETDWSVVYATVALDQQARRQVQTTSAATEPDRASVSTGSSLSSTAIESGPRLTWRVDSRQQDGEQEEGEQAEEDSSLTEPAPVVQGADMAESEQPSAQLDAGEASAAEGQTPQPSPTVEAKPPLRPEVLELQKKVRQALAIYYPRQLNTRDHDVWQIMHSLIAYGVETNVHVGAPGGPSANAIGWVCFNGVCKGKRLFYLSRSGRLEARQGPGVQGHHGQFLAMLAQSRVMIDYPIKVNDHDFTVADLVEFEKATCQPKSELTFKLIALAHYLDLNETWQNDYGQEWSIPRLISEEIAQPIRGAACGGTHRLFGLSYAVQRRMRRGEPLDGEYLRAAKYIRDYHRYTFSMQNRDGSLSTEWFTRPGNRNDVDRKIQTSGHILEWLVLSLPEDELQGAPMSRAIDFLASTLIAGQNRKWEIGPLGHALHALVMYDQRIAAMQKAREPAPAAIAQQTDEADDTEAISIEIEDGAEEAQQPESARPAALDIQSSTDDPLPRQARLPELAIPQTMIR